MTVACAAPIVDARSPEAVLNVLRGDGLRVSTARRAVVARLFSAEGPLSAEQIASGLEQGGIPVDKGSVYRGLETLERLGLVRHFHAGHAPGRYLLAGGTDRELIACERCGEVSEVPAEALDPLRSEIQQRLGFEVSFTHFPMVGTCPDCAGEVG
jgi:Fur family transcriptional regulator, ferric uptake regulator